MQVTHKPAQNRHLISTETSKQNSIIFVCLLARVQTKIFTKKNQLASVPNSERGEEIKDRTYSSFRRLWTLKADGESICCSFTIDCWIATAITP
jgi:hypothetical protein